MNIMHGFLFLGEGLLYFFSMMLILSSLSKLSTKFNESSEKTQKMIGYCVFIGIPVMIIFLIGCFT